MRNDFIFLCEKLSALRGELKFLYINNNQSTGRQDEIGPLIGFMIATMEIEVGMKEILQNHSSAEQKTIISSIFSLPKSYLKILQQLNLAPACLETPFRTFLKNGEYIMVFHRMVKTFERVQFLMRDPLHISESKSAEPSVDRIPLTVKKIILEELWPGLQFLQKMKNENLEIKDEVENPLFNIEEKEEFQENRNNYTRTFIK